LQPPQAAVRPEFPANLQARQQQLEIDPHFLGQLVDEVLARSSAPGSAVNQTQATDRGAIARSLMDNLQALSPAARRKLGTYRRADYDQWLVQLGETGTASQILDRLADDRMAELFPDLKGKDLNPRTFGQVWYALAEAQLSVALAQKAAGKPGNR
jgi:serine/threonine-protein kinase